MLSDLRPAVVSTLLFTLLLGLGYPLAVTAVAGAALPYQAGGSLVRDAAGRVAGSALLAQGFARPQYLHPRPSAAGKGYDPTSSGGSNLGPLNPDLEKRMAADARTIRADTGAGVLPDDAVTASGSGLDPDISPDYALLQVGRIAAARHMAPEKVRSIIAGHIQGPMFGFLGQARVNVLMANLALDAASARAAT